MKTKTSLMVSTNPFEKYELVKLDHFPGNRDENEEIIDFHHELFSRSLVNSKLTKIIEGLPYILTYTILFE